MRAASSGWRDGRSASASTTARFTAFAPWLPPMTRSENFAGSAFEPPTPFPNSARSGRPVSARRAPFGKKRAMSGKQTQTVAAKRARCATAEPGMAFASWRTTGTPSVRAARTGAIEV